MIEVPNFRMDGLSDRNFMLFLLTCEVKTRTHAATSAHTSWEERAIVETQWNSESRSYSGSGSNTAIPSDKVLISSLSYLGGTIDLSLTEGLYPRRNGLSLESNPRMTGRP